MTNDKGSRLAAPIPGADAGEEPPFLVGKRLNTGALDLFQQFVHALFLGLTSFLLAAGPLGGSFLQPALEPIRPLSTWRRRGRLGTFQARISLRKIIAERRFLAAGFQHDELLLATDIHE